MTSAFETVEVEKNVLYGGPIKFNVDVTKSLGLVLIDLLKKHEDKVVLIDGITDVQVTYKQLLNDIIETAKCLRAAGLQVGDTLGIASENRLEFALPLLAAFLIGVTVAPMNSSYTDREFLHTIELSRPKLIFVSAASSNNVLYAASKTNCVQKIIQFGDILINKSSILFNDFIQQYKEPYPIEFIPAMVNVNEHNALIVCSSGTTGLPKGVQLTHVNVMSAIGLFKSLVMGNIENFEDVRVLGVLPFFHVYGCLTLVGVCAFGGSIVIVPKFEESSFMSCIQKYKITLLFTVPPLMIFLSKHPMVANYDVSSVREFFCGAAPLGAETGKAVEKRFKNATVRQLYGMSEVTFSVICQRTTVHKPGSIGILSQATYCKVIDPETGKILGKNQVGELCFKGSQVMKGYIGNEEATRNTIDEDRWLHSGDIGYYDDDYHFYIVDRLKELIKYKGFQVAPAELESILLTNPKIKDVAVIGLPDEASGELPLAFVVLQPNVKLTEKEVIIYVEERVSSAKRLRGGVRFIDVIPKTPSGKILRRELRALFAKSKL